MKKLTLILFVVAFLGSLNVMADETKEIKKTFDAKETLKVNTASGDCDITIGDNNKIMVRVEYTFDNDCYEVKFDESGNMLQIEEDFSGSCNGKSHFFITVPANIYVIFKSASGDFTLEGTNKGAKINVASGDCKIVNVTGEVNMNSASGDLEIKGINGNLNCNAASGDIDIANISGMVETETASGDIKIINVENGLDAGAASGDIKLENISGECKVATASGDIDAEKVDGNTTLKAASGDITLNNATGRLVLKTASGNITAENIIVTEASELKAASGNVGLSLKESLTYDLTLSAASGDVTIAYNGNEIKGFFEFSAREDKGTIVSPIKFGKD